VKRGNIIMRRVWAMPCKDTFNIFPIGEFVRRYLNESKISIDPFSRNKKWTTHTNDLNPATLAEYHLDVFDFLEMLYKKEIKADLVIFDPPFSPRQIKECYDNIGLKMGSMDAFRTHWKPERDLIDKILDINGIVLSFGWNSIGMGIKRAYRQEEILLVCHGPGHNDTICLAERKTQKQLTLKGVCNETKWSKK
jgi:hypothetical protein